MERFACLEPFRITRTVSQFCVRRVRVEGLKWTKKDIVMEQIKGVLKATSREEVREINLTEINEVLKV